MAGHAGHGLFLERGERSIVALSFLKRIFREMRMNQVTLIGAGSAGFCRTLVQDILSFESMRDIRIALMDTDPARLAGIHRVMQNMKAQNRLSCTFSAHTRLQDALKGSDFAISMIQVGGLEPYRLDIEIPLRHGVDQCVGDTLNPGGLFRGLRHIAAFMDMLRVMEKVCPDILFMNYANPMAICSRAMQKAYPHIVTVGLCHGVQHTTRMLADWLGLPPGECDVLTAGINHMAWFLQFRHKGRDLYPALWRKLDRDGCIRGEEYRFEMMKATGHFMTESPGHLSEYLPYFRKRRDLQTLFGGPGFSGETGAYLRMCQEGAKAYRRDVARLASGRVRVPYEPGVKSIEYAANIMNARITGEITRFAGNIANKGFIENLPAEACVEVPVFVDRLGMHGTHVGRLPPVCAALCQSNISFQELAVQAGLEGDYEAAYHACLLDPLTAAVLAPHEIRNLTDEMFRAQMKWLPQFRKIKTRAPGHTIGRIRTGARLLKRGRNLKRQIGHTDRVDR
jgi:alpha-galactosidase